ncbi:hypothetical protein FOXG_21062 [Fusarium oxysporum f. sp. lycopersici 4287]|uniref:RRM domain-containing protein n=1 Tax=Fusarium oxysporum f. sp. lycopersici (strain 4287 / CBS 123668 / FGSC 9935 / NRRL 34936) TaxID=426428 RepID=A0A0J9VTS8_FUSO4|nr:hypothetical protein FOXG_21062 [Fusarium oxysporum f. sp. lycopersici 4287]KNB14151.1 hypothetical protein FOXG_21062 [Fusarium oxysporum f. sp. lycopersici 4287]
MSAKVYVGNLSWNTDDESLRSHFSNYGNILDSAMLEAAAVAMQEVKAVMVEDTAVVILKEDMVEAIKATDM